MPTFYMENQEGYVRNDFDNYVQVTLGDDPVVICCDEATAARLVDAKIVAAAVQSAFPRKQSYDADLSLFLVRLREVWPLRRPPTWQQLSDIMNHCEILSPQGAKWTRHNLMQKLKAMGWDAGQLANPEGAEEVVSMYDRTLTKEIDALPVAIERVVGKVVYGQPDEGTGPTKASNNLFDASSDEDPF